MENFPLICMWRDHKGHIWYLFNIQAWIWHVCVCVYESEVREYPPPDLITVALHKPLCYKEVKATAIYYPQSISHFLYSGVVKHTH